MRVIFALIFLVVFSNSVAEAAKSKRIRSVKKTSGRYMYECSTSFEPAKQPITVHAEYFKKCNTMKEFGPLCRVDLNDKSETQLEKFIVSFQNDIRQGNAEGAPISKCPAMLGAIREIMDSNGCTARVSICYPSRFVKNNRSKALKSDRMPASVPNPKPKRTKVDF